MINAPDIKRFIPKHYLKEYPIFVEFLQEYFNYLHRVRLLTPDLENKLREILTDERDIDLLRNLKNEVDTLRDQRNFTNKPEKNIVVKLKDGRILATNDGRMVAFQENNKIEINAINSDRDFETEFDSIRKGVYGIDQKRFIRIFKDLKSIAGSQQIIKLFFSWLYDGEINVYYPKIDIAKLDDNAVLDGRQKLRDDVFYSEFSYQVQAYGRQLVPVVEPYHEIYKKHFHPAGFSLFIENNKPSSVRPYDFPLLIPSGAPNSFYRLGEVITVEKGEEIYLRTLQDLDISLTIDGPLFDDILIKDNKIIFNENLWNVRYDGQLIYNGYLLQIDGNFHDYNFVYKGDEPYVVDSFLKSKIDGDKSGVVPINNIKHLNTIGEVIIEYRINNLSSNGVPAYGIKNKKLPQLCGLYHLDEKATQRVTMGLKPNSKYMIYVNGADTIGKISLAVGTTEFIVFDVSEEKSSYIFLDTPETINSEDINVTSIDGASKLQIIVYEINPKVLYFQRDLEEDFGLTGFWVNSRGENVEVISRLVTVLEINANDLVRYVKLTLPKSMGSNYRRLEYLIDQIGDGVDNVEADFNSFEKFINEELPNSLGYSKERIIVSVDKLIYMMQSVSNDINWFDNFVNEELPYSLNNQNLED
ncbi:hypothetical protein Kuja_0020 [Vibrio phage vB_VchM_Kuja]|uniref:Uncharacterized protein n=1 Tax=Vibrio phage vB_VchM_Kuja TaxID=2686437 RepID=A0A6B9J8Z2_9CAUD|nr:head closure Hc2 [Vibrio phage vB_VchM_Kuja]QGZ15993.1 hypothetical protein Kuja_0020 [Vibrio phage vB_VchM_Kuja]